VAVGLGLNWVGVERAVAAVLAGGRRLGAERNGVRGVVCALKDRLIDLGCVL
jgi:hypothetical protein